MLSLLRPKRRADLTRDLRFQDITIMYFTGLAALMVILVGSYQAPGNATNVSSFKSNASRPLPPLPMPFRVPLDPRGELQLAWNISYADQEVYMALRVAELRYGVVLGMSDRGELTNADLVVLWDSGTKSYFGDAWSDSEGRVSLDSQQDYELLEAKQKPDGFFLLFKRPFSTCDPRDYLIEEGTVHMIYGFLDQPLASLEQLNLSRIHTGLQRVLMLRPDTPAPTLPPDVRTLDVVSPNVIIPNQETTYWCFIQKLPENMPKNHIVMCCLVLPGTASDRGTSPRKNNGGRERKGELRKFEQRDDDVRRRQNAKAGLLSEIGKDTAEESGSNQDSSIIARRFDTHWGRHDSSGIRLHYTPSLRRYDAGIMELGLIYTPIMAIPPKQRTFYLSGYCTSKCTKTALPSGGIYIFASQLHTHLAGRGVRTVVVRGGKELELVQEDQHFSAHYQGDVLITKCTYNTEDRSRPTVGGFGIMDEMCVDYVHYYPRTQLELCKSHVDAGYLQKYFNFINRFHGNDQCVCGEVSVTEQYSQLQWDAFTEEVLNSLYNTAPITMHCTQSTARPFPGEWDQQPLPVATAVLGKPRYPCEGGAPPPTGQPLTPPV
ncbi:hypothetical protein F2P81_015927 [Scophthalmus maximus]|uniref:DOMON domain-containing protein n=1 Tax=Scophthalmus maximus TaxID=52904 RepID=A0A6A4SM32_SCOMX|nr:hypothetical protein F2P81_015927 [Scophthalmus maximus]